MEAVEAEDEGLRSLIAQELSYMQALWWMYTDRVCPAPPVWQAPFSYSPATFSDTLIGMSTMGNDFFFKEWLSGSSTWIVERVAVRVLHPWKKLVLSGVVFELFSGVAIDWDSRRESGYTRCYAPREHVCCHSDASWPFIF